MKELLKLTRYQINALAQNKQNWYWETQRLCRLCEESCTPILKLFHEFLAIVKDLELIFFEHSEVDSRSNVYVRNVSRIT